jgi:TolB-like protein
VLSQDEAAGSKETAASSQSEENQKANGKSQRAEGEDSPAFSGQSLGLEGQDLASSVQSSESEELKPPTNGQPFDSGLLTPDVIASRHTRSIRPLFLIGLLLLVGVVGAEWWFVRSLNSLPEKPSIAVMPFANLSDDPQLDYLGYGVTTDLEVDLSKLSGLTVIARQSTVLFKDKEVNVQEASKKLAVRYLVQGSVRKAGDRLFITAQLVDGDGQQIWAERYDRPLPDLFAVQGEVRHKIVVQLGLKLTPEEEERLQRIYTPNLEAYNYVAHAKEAYVRITPVENARARQFYEKAVALDPSYAVAYAGLGFTYAQAWGNLWTQDPQALERVFEFAQKALALDSSSPVAHELLGVAYLWRDPQLEQAIATYQKILALIPHHPTARAGLAAVYSELGREDEAQTMMPEALTQNAQITLEDVRLRLPYKDPAELERHLNALRKAGLK